MSKKKSLDGNTAAAHIAYAFSEVSAIYPITPSTTMAELVDQWITEGKKNLFDEVPTVAEMQSEAGAAGAVHGVLSAGALATTFTASQGLLLMIPNMYKIAGELLPTVFHVTARAIASQALSIFGDHQDVMAVRQTGFALLCSSSVQEAQDLALVAHLSTLRASVPFLHFFDGFRTSHEIQKIDLIDYDSIKPLVDQKALQRHRDHALNPMHPYLKGTAQNPDIYFQENEALNPFYFKIPDIVEEEMEKVYQLTKRRYHLFDYVGDPNAERVIVIMGSGAEAVEETVNYLNQKNEKVGLIKVRLYRPFSKVHFLKVLPKTVKKIAVLDRTKENGSFAEPLYLDVSSIIKDENLPIELVCGRYGLGSKDFTPSQIKAIFDNLKKKESKSHFTVGIVDDVTFLSLPVTEQIDTEDKGTVRCKFWGIGGDGTVGANKDAIKIIGDNTDKYVQGYFVYDSKKTSGITISHLRFGNKPIHSTYLIQIADYIACHHPSYVLKYDLLEGIKEKGIFVLNAPWETLEEINEHLPNSLKKQIAEKKLQFYVINAAKLAKELGLGNRINMIMQTAFFKLSEIIPIEKAISLLKEAVQKTYGKKGEKIVQMNNQAIDGALKNLQKIPYPSSWAILKEEIKEEKERPDFIKRIADVMNAQKGDTLPVSVFAPGGEFPLETTKYERRAFATQLAKWKPENCIQCNQCAFVCPHAAIRPYLATEDELKTAPNDYVALNPLGGKAFQGYKFSIQVSPYDCTGCTNCVVACPAKQKALEMVPREVIEENEKKWWDYAVELPRHIPDISKFNVKGSQFQKPLLEFSGACAGCGETTYVKALTQLFGERMMISNATGCSSIWGGSAPSIPFAKTDKGYGPAWANSLFEDNAEYGFGMYLAIATRRGILAHHVEKALQTEAISGDLKMLFEEWLTNKSIGEKTLAIAEKIIQDLKKQKVTPLIQQIKSMQDLFVKPSIWIIGGDGWAYDIGYGGLDHVLAMNQDVKVLVLDTEVYSNTGGQASKATPIGAVAKFASNGKKTLKKDLGRIAMTYGNIYVASIAMGYDMPGVIRAFKEAEEYDGPALIIAYASCIAHGIRGGLANSQVEEKIAVESGYWINYRYDPRLKDQGKNPFQLDSKEPTIPIKTFIESEERYNILLRTNPEEAKRLQKEFEKYVAERYSYYKKLSESPLQANLPLEG